MTIARSSVSRTPTRSSLFVVALLAGGCAAGEEELERGAYYDEIVAAGENAASEFERNVLADGDITRSEYEEAVERFVRCAADRGVAITPVKQGSRYSYEMATSADSDQVALDCSVGTTQQIESLYGELVSNPTNGDYDQLVADCLVRSGLAPEGYTKEEFLAQREQNLAFDASDPRMQECFEDVEAY